MKIAAAIPAYNRPALLVKCLEGLLAQTRLPDVIIVIDNNSSEETKEALGTYLRRREIYYYRLDENVGSAGGYTAALQIAIKQDVDWVWTMDDDAVPEPDALSELLRGLAATEATLSPAIMASMVVWTDGKLHPMNAPYIRDNDAEAVVKCAELGLVALRAISWTGMMISRDAILSNDPPVSDYFVWTDDCEYTGRVLKSRIGILCPRSRIIHHSKSKELPYGNVSGQFYYEVRNQLWMLFYSNAWSAKEKLKFAGRLIISISENIRRSKSFVAAIRVILHGVWNAIVTRPHKNAYDWNL